MKQFKIIYTDLRDPDCRKINAIRSGSSKEEVEDKFDGHWYLLSIKEL